MHRNSRHPSNESAARTQHLKGKSLQDRSRVAAIYRSCHRAADQHLQNHITVKLTVDSYDVLEIAARFYNQFKELLPAKVRLRLYYYDADLNTSVLFSEINGEGLTDINYEASVEHMLMLAKIGQPNAHATSVNVADEMDVHEFLAYRAAIAGEKTLAVMMDADGCFYSFHYHVLLKLIEYTHGEAIRQALMQVNMGQDVSDLIESIRVTIRDCHLEAWDPRDENLLECEKHVSYEQVPVLRANLHLLCPQLMNDIHFRLHHKLVERLLEDAERQQCKSVVFMFGTSRQSYSLNQFNAEKYYTGCFMRDLQSFTRDLNQRLHQRIRFCLDRFLLSDAYNNLKQGESFMRIYHAAHGSDDLQYPRAIYDGSKATVVYACGQHAKRMYPGVTSMNFVEDLEEIAAILLKYFKQKYHVLLPHGLNIHLIMYNGEFIESKCNDAICGSGSLDRRLYHSIQLMGCHAVRQESLAEAIMQPGKDFITRGSLQKLVETLAEMRARKQQELMRLFGATGNAVVTADIHTPKQDMRVGRFH